MARKPRFRIVKDAWYESTDTAAKILRGRGKKEGKVIDKVVFYKNWKISSTFGSNWDGWSFRLKR